MDHNTNKVLLNLRKSRKSYILEYICGFSLFSLLVYSIFRGVVLSRWLTYPVLSVAVFAIASAELSRLMNKYEFAGEKLTIYSGLIKKHKKHINYYAISFSPDFNVSQNFIQRLLNYGSIYVENGGVKSFTIKDIDNPHRIMEKMEEFIEASRKSMHGNNSENEHLPK